MFNLKKLFNPHLGFNLKETLIIKRENNMHIKFYDKY